MQKVCTKIKLQFRERYVRARQMSFSAIFLLNKTTAPIFQIIHIQSETLDPCVNVGIEQRRNVQTRHHDLFTF